MHLHFLLVGCRLVIRFSGEFIGTVELSYSKPLKITYIGRVTGKIVAKQAKSFVWQGRCV
jgi:hypothetical protein